MARSYQANASKLSVITYTWLQITLSNDLINLPTLCKHCSARGLLNKIITTWCKSFSVCSLYRELRNRMHIIYSFVRVYTFGTKAKKKNFGNYHRSVRGRFFCVIFFFYKFNFWRVRKRETRAFTTLGWGRKLYIIEKGCQKSRNKQESCVYYTKFWQKTIELVNQV